MARKAIKTIEDARAAMLDLLPPGVSLFAAADWHDIRDLHGWRQSVNYRASVYQDSRECFATRGPTPADLYRNFCQALDAFLAPRRLAAEQLSRPMRRTLAAVAANGRAAIVSDEHDHVRPIPRVNGTVVKRICGPQ